MFVRCGVFFLPCHVFFSRFYVCIFHVFFPFLRVNFSRENNLRSRMFVRCGVFFEIADVC